MLLVVLGAGASYDCNPLGEDFQWRPPLTAELFTRPEFRAAMEEYPRMGGLVHKLRDLPKDVTVEERLDEIQQDSEKYPAAKNELMAVRYYLRRTLADCSEAVMKATRSASNYATLIRQIDRWRHERDETVLVVNFNYDLVFDRAMRSQFGIDDGPDLNWHIQAVAGWHHVKIHGSCDWGVAVEDVTYSPVQRGPGAVDAIRQAQTLKESDTYMWWPTANTTESFIYEGPNRNQAVVPALALPLRAKSQFVCPSSHRALLGNSLHSVDRLVTIGWRGQDQHFLKLLREGECKPGRILAVTKSERGASEVRHALIHEAGVPRQTSFRPCFHEQTPAFTALLKSGTLLEFLAS